MLNQEESEVHDRLLPEPRVFAENRLISAESRSLCHLNSFIEPSEQKEKGVEKEKEWRSQESGERRRSFEGKERKRQAVRNRA